MIRHVKLTCRGMSFNDWEKVIDTTAVSQTIGHSLQRSLIQKGAKNTSCPKTARPVSLPEGVSTNIPIFCWLNPFESLWNPTKPPWNPMKSEWNQIRPPKSCCLSGAGPERLGVVGERRSWHVSAGEASAGLSRLRSAGGVLADGMMGWSGLARYLYIKYIFIICIYIYV